MQCSGRLLNSAEPLALKSLSEGDQVHGRVWQWLEPRGGPVAQPTCDLVKSSLNYSGPFRLLRMDVHTGRHRNSCSADATGSGLETHVSLWSVLFHLFHWVKTYCKGVKGAITHGYYFDFVLDFSFVLNYIFCMLTARPPFMSVRNSLSLSS